MQQPGISDRSFQYGDGVFTTIRVARGQLRLWPYHWLRLNASLQRLGMAAVDEIWLKHQAERQISAPEQVLKIVISRGQGGRGYSPARFYTGAVLLQCQSAAGLSKLATTRFAT